MSCRICEAIIEIEMTEEQQARIRLGKEHIQSILPSPQYTGEQRELFQSGFCDVCWDKVFPPDNEEEHLAFIHGGNENG